MVQPVDITSRVRLLRNKVHQYQDRGLGEQDTKGALIEPLLESLGWDIRDPDEVHREFKSRPRDKPVDYALKLLRKPRLLIEAKGLGENLSDRRWISQVLSYATVAGAEWCVLTDGNQWRLYNPAAPLDAEEKLFLRITVSEAEPEVAAARLPVISRENLEENLLETIWNAHFVDRRVRAALQKMFDGVENGLVRLIRKHEPKLSPRVVRESIQRFGIQIPVPATPLEKPRRSEAPKPLKSRSGAAKKAWATRRTRTQVSLEELIRGGSLSAPLRLFKRYKKHDLVATLHRDGTVEFEGKRYATSSTAAAAARGTVTGRPMATNGWTFWHFTDGDKRRSLDDARQAFLKGAIIRMKQA